MTDVHDRAKRSENMSRIRSRGNASTELRFVSLLRSAKITQWRRQSDLPGRPDFVFRRRHLVVFIDGCFWHGCRRCGFSPRNNRQYWKKKFARNIARDRRVERLLRNQGWRIMRVWEHSLGNAAHVSARLRRMLERGRTTPFPARSGRERKRNV